MFKCTGIHGLAPYYSSNEVKSPCKLSCLIEIQIHVSINTCNVNVQQAPLESFKNSFAFRGPVIWNGLPNNTHQREILETFKKHLRKFVSL